MIFSGMTLNMEREKKRKKKKVLHETHYSSDFDNRKDEFGFTIGFDSEEVDHDNGDEKDSHKDRLAKVFVPVANGKSAGDDL